MVLSKGSNRLGATLTEDGNTVDFRNVAFNVYLSITGWTKPKEEDCICMANYRPTNFVLLVAS